MGPASQRERANPSRAESVRGWVGPLNHWPSDSNRAAQMRSRPTDQVGATSWLGRAKWLEPEPDSRPLNSRTY